MTSLRDRTAGLPRWVGGIGRVVWPMALLLLFVVAFRRADAGDGAAENVEEATGSLRLVAQAECEQPQHADILVLERCLSVQPDDVDVMLELGAAYESMGRQADAERVYVRAVSVDARDGDVHLRLGRLLLARGDVTGARREGQAALATQPGSQGALRLAEAETARVSP